MFKLFILYLLYFCALSPVYSNTCQEVLFDNPLVIELPGKGNQFTRRGFDSLNKLNKELILAVQSGLNSLTRPEVINVVKLMNQPVIMQDNIKIPQLLQDLGENKAYKDTLYLNYSFLHDQLSDELNETEIIGLSLLFSGVSRKRPFTSGAYYFDLITSKEALDASFLSQGNNGKLASRAFEKLINQPIFASVILELFKDGKLTDQINQIVANYARTFAVKEANKSQFQQIKQRSLQELETLAAKIEADYIASDSLDPLLLESNYRRNGSFSNKSLIKVEEAIRTLSTYIKSFYTDLKLDIIRIEDADITYVEHMKDLDRGDRLSVLENFFIKFMHDQSNLTALTELFDHLIFGSSIPLTDSEVESLISLSLKNILVPARLEISQNRVEREKKNSASLPVREFRFSSSLYNSTAEPLKDTQSEPVINPNKRRNGKRKKSVKEETRLRSRKGSAEVAARVRISDDVRLLNFTSFVNSPKAISELSNDTTYQFRFMRDSGDSPIQTIQFEASVLKDLIKNEAIAKKQLRALVLGKALRHNQDGLKIMGRSPTQSQGRFYEVKIVHKTARLLLIHNNGHWRVVKSTDKTKIDQIMLTEF